MLAYIPYMDPMGIDIAKNWATAGHISGNGKISQHFWLEKIIDTKPSFFSGDIVWGERWPFNQVTYDKFNGPKLDLWRVHKSLNCFCTNAKGW